MRRPPWGLPAANLSSISARGALADENDGLALDFGEVALASAPLSAERQFAASADLSALRQPPPAVALAAARPGFAWVPQPPAAVPPGAPLSFDFQAKVPPPSFTWPGLGMGAATSRGSPPGLAPRQVTPLPAASSGPEPLLASPASAVEHRGATVPSW